MSARTLLARRLGVWFAPPVLPAVAGSVVSWSATWPSLRGFVWGVAGAGAWAMLWAAWAVWGVRSGWWPSPAPTQRRHRLWLVAVGAGSAVVVWAGCAGLGAPHELLLLGAGLPLGVALALACTCMANVSLHTMAAAGGVTLLVLHVDARCAVLFPLVVAIAWSRLRLGVHTRWQVLVGAALGTAFSAGVVFLSH